MLCMCWMLSSWIGIWILLFGCSWLGWGGSLGVRLSVCGCRLGCRVCSRCCARLVLGRSGSLITCGSCSIIRSVSRIGRSTGAGLICRSFWLTRGSINIIWSTSKYNYCYKLYLTLWKHTQNAGILQYYYKYSFNINSC